MQNVGEFTPWVITYQKAYEQTILTRGHTCQCEFWLSCSDHFNIEIKYILAESQKFHTNFPDFSCIVKNSVEESLSNVFTIVMWNINWISVEGRVGTRNLVRSSTSDMFINMFRTGYVCLLTGFDTSFLMFFMIFEFAKFRAVPPLFTIVAFYCRFLFTTAAFLVWVTSCCSSCSSFSTFFRIRSKSATK